MIFKTLILALAIFVSIAINAQENVLLGRWQLTEMMQDSVIIFDRNNLQVSIDAKFVSAKRNNQSLSKRDSLDIIKSVKSIHPLMVKMYYEFKENGSLNAGIMLQKRNKFYFAETDGSYMVDFQKLGIILKAFGSSIQTYYFEVNTNFLVLKQFLDGGFSLKDYAKYEYVR